jgi:hypothetical protein
MERNDIYIEHWDEETGTATVSCKGKYRDYVGVAHVHPDDNDMKSQLVGIQIAEQRLQIEILKDYIHSELEPGLAALKQLYFSMKHSSHFSPRSYEAKMLYKQIKLKEEDLADAKELLRNVKSALKHYIDIKEKNYQAIRKKRNNK